MKLVTLLCGALLLAPGSGLHAQAPSAAPRQQPADCSKAKDPRACEARRAKARRELCAQSGNPVKCEAQAKQRRRK